MNNGQKVLAAMLAVAVVVLAMVAFAPRPQTPTVIAGAVGPAQVAGDPTKLWRFWSDGRVDVSLIDGELDCVAVVQCGPPFVVIP